MPKQRNSGRMSAWYELCTTTIIQLYNTASVVYHVTETKDGALLAANPCISLEMAVQKGDNGASLSDLTEA